MTSPASILGIETSCDETAAAVVDRGREVLAHASATQDDLHAPHGGVVPELASRRHAEVIDQVVEQVLDRAGLEARDLAAIAVTQGPGLIGALAVGVAYAKALAYGTGVPLIGVHHLDGHIAATGLGAAGPSGPFVALLASGGHTGLYAAEAAGGYRILGQTRDDAAGEALDKAAKLLGLGYPGGPALEAAARGGDPAWLALPRAMPGSLEFSFSGLKTALVHAVRKTGQEDVEAHRADIAASVQQAVMEVLVEKLVLAVNRTGVREVVVAGGVAANGLLRALLCDRLGRRGITVHIPQPAFCTDNGAMVAAAGYRLYLAGRFASLDLAPQADLPLVPVPLT